MSRRSLRPQLNQIRGWVRQGRTDAWIAHQLEVTVQQIQAFKREQELEADGAEPGGAAFEEVDLRAEDDAAIAAELEEEAAQRAEEEAKAEEAARKAAEEEERRRRGRSRRRRRGRGRGRRRGQAQARPPQPRRPHAPPHRRAAPARGHLRPRRGGLRPVARPRRAGRSRLRRALGGPPPRRDHDRGGPDRDPPRRRGRGRRRGLTAPAAPGRSPGGARGTPGSATWSSRGARHRGPLHARCRRAGTTTACASRRRTRASSADALSRAADDPAGRPGAPPDRGRGRGGGRAPAAGLRRARLGDRAAARWMLLDGPPPGGRRLRGGPVRRHARLRIEWARRLPWAPDDDAAERLRRARGRRSPTLRGTRALVARDDAGAPAASCASWTQGDAPRSSRCTSRRPSAAAAWAVGWCARPRRTAAADRRRSSSPTTRATRSASTRGSASRRCGSSTSSPRRPGLASIGEPPAARVVGRAAQVAAEGGVGDRADVPRVRVLGRDRHGEVRGPARALVVRGRRARRREGAAEAAAQLASIAPVTRSSATLVGRRRRLARRSRRSCHCGERGLGRHRVPG